MERIDMVTTTGDWCQMVSNVIWELLSGIWYNGGLDIALTRIQECTTSAALWLA